MSQASTKKQSFSETVMQHNLACAAPVYDMCANLASSRLKHEQILARATTVNVVKCIIPGGDLRESKYALRLCKRFPEKLVCGVGVHPHWAADPFRKNRNRNHDYTENAKAIDPIDLKYEIRELCNEDDASDTSDDNAKVKNSDDIHMNGNESKVRFSFIGECGLDYNRMFSPQHIQLSIFEQQIQMAIELNLPLFCHERDAHRDFIRLIHKYSYPLQEEKKRGVVKKRLPVPVLVHCFHGAMSELITYVNMGCYIGVTTVLCIENRSRVLRKGIRDGLLPIERLVIETDAPYMCPEFRNYDNNQNYRQLKPLLQSKNEPCLLPCLVNALYNCYRQRYSHKQICEITTQNANDFFHRRYAVEKPPEWKELPNAKRHNVNHKRLVDDK